MKLQMAALKKSLLREEENSRKKKTSPSFLESFSLETELEREGRGGPNERAYKDEEVNQGEDLSGCSIVVSSNVPSSVRNYPGSHEATERGTVFLLLQQRLAIFCYLLKVECCCICCMGAAKE